MIVLLKRRHAVTADRNTDAFCTNFTDLQVVYSTGL